MIIYIGYKKDIWSKQLIDYLFAKGYRLVNTPEYEIPLMVGIKVDTEKRTVSSASGTIMACYVNSHGCALYPEDLCDFRKQIFIDQDEELCKDLWEKKSKLKIPKLTKRTYEEAKRAYQDFLKKNKK